MVVMAQDKAQLVVVLSWTVDEKKVLRVLRKNCSPVLLRT